MKHVHVCRVRIKCMNHAEKEEQRKRSRERGVGHQVPVGHFVVRVKSAVMKPKTAVKGQSRFLPPVQSRAKLSRHSLAVTEHQR